MKNRNERVLLGLMVMTGLAGSAAVRWGSNTLQWIILGVMVVLVVVHIFTTDIWRRKKTAAPLDEKPPTP
jgi:hypothetical protein